MPPVCRSVTPMWKPTSITGLQRSIFSKYFSSAWGNVSPGVCMQKSISVVVPPNAAETVPGGEVVARDGSSEEHLEVRVRVDRARDHVLAGGVDDLVGGNVERLADQRDRAVVDEDVADVVVGRGHDPAALDEYRHEPQPFVEKRVLCIRLPRSDRKSLPARTPLPRLRPDGCLRTAPMPVRDVLKRRRGAEHGRLAGRAADEREPGRHVLDEAARHACDRGARERPG